MPLEITPGDYLDGNDDRVTVTQVLTAAGEYPVVAQHSRLGCVRYTRYGSFHGDGRQVKADLVRAAPDAGGHAVMAFHAVDPDAKPPRAAVAAKTGAPEKQQEAQLRDAKEAFAAEQKRAIPKFGVPPQMPGETSDRWLARVGDELQRWCARVVDAFVSAGAARYVPTLAGVQVEAVNMMLAEARDKALRRAADSAHAERAPADCQGPGPVEIKSDAVHTGTRKEYILREALAAVADRGLNYGKPEDNFDRVARYWNAHLVNRYGDDARVCLDAIDVALMCGHIKDARIDNTPDHYDSWVDKAGYAACGGEIASKRLTPNK